MCLSVPGKVISIDNKMAEISIGGSIYKAGTHLMDEVKVDDFVLIHTGYIIQKLSEQDAEETMKYLIELGEIDEEIRNGEV